MRQMQHSDPRPPDRLGEIITDSSVRGYYRDMIGHLNKLHGDVEIYQSEVDVRAEYAGRLICRIVPYRELLHIQIGDSPVWEIRVKNEAGFMESMGRILETFLKMAAEDHGTLRVRPGPHIGTEP